MPTPKTELSKKALSIFPDLTAEELKLIQASLSSNMKTNVELLITYLISRHRRYDQPRDMVPLFTKMIKTRFDKDVVIMISETGKKVEDVVIDTVCKVFEIEKEHLLSKLQIRKLCDARMTISSILHSQYSYTIYQVANILNRDRSTISTRFHVHDDLLKVDKAYRSKYYQVLAILKDHEL
jgi:chromosomal replication initiation ATPase DnaA